MRQLLLPFVLATLMACGSSSSPSAGSACTAAGGSCVLGGAACAKQAASSAQDCNPDVNPGGAFCCLAVGDGGAKDAEPMDSGKHDAADSGGDAGCLGAGAPCTDPFLCCSQSCSTSSRNEAGSICAP